MENGMLTLLKEKKWTFAVILIALLGVGVVYYASMEDPNDPRIALAQCLTEKKTKMYGAFWCPHCQAQKKIFGSSFSRVEYVECGVPGNTAGQTQACIDAKIQNYPTWEFADGSRVTGEQTLSSLAEKSQCEWNESE